MWLLIVTKHLPNWILQLIGLRSDMQMGVQIWENVYQTKYLLLLARWKYTLSCWTLSHAINNKPISAFMKILIKRVYEKMKIYRIRWKDGNLSWFIRKESPLASDQQWTYFSFVSFLIIFNCALQEDQLVLLLMLYCSQNTYRKMMDKHYK